MDWLQIEGKGIPLLEAPQKYENPPRRILYVVFKHKEMIVRIFLLLSVPVCLYLLFRPSQYFASSKVLIKPSRGFLSISPSPGGRDESLIFPTPEIINSEIEIIRSPHLLERLAKDVPFPDRSDGKAQRAPTEEEAKRDARRL